MNNKRVKLVFDHTKRNASPPFNLPWKVIWIENNQVVGRFQDWENALRCAEQINFTVIEVEYE